MRARTCFKESPRERYDRLTCRPELLATDQAASPTNRHQDSERSNTLVLVEVEGGLVQNVTLLNQSVQPVLVLVRDYDNFKTDPDDYQDAEWLLV